MPRKLRDLRESDVHSSIQFDNNDLNHVDNYLHLGISLDNDLKWESQT